MEPEPLEQQEWQDERGQDAPDFLLEGRQPGIERARVGQARQPRSNVAFIWVGQIRGKQIVVDGLLAALDDLLHAVQARHVRRRVGDRALAGANLGGLIGRRYEDSEVPDFVPEEWAEPRGDEPAG